MTLLKTFIPLKFPYCIATTSASKLLICTTFFNNKLSRPLARYSTKPQKQDRHYFYCIDVHGQLFLEETVPKNLTSCFKDSKFLNFFFTRLRINHHPEVSKSQYPYLSQCGKEFNFIETEDAPLVFHDLRDNGTSLVWAGDLRFPFDPAKIHVSIKTGRMYHPAPLELHRYNPTTDQGLPKDVPDYIQRNLALLKSSLVLSTFMDDLDMNKGTLSFQNQIYPLTFF